MSMFLREVLEGGEVVGGAEVAEEKHAVKGYRGLVLKVSALHLVMLLKFLLILFCYLFNTIDIY